MNSSGLNGKRALVTGAASGIGAAIVEALRAEGVQVAGLDINEHMDVDCKLVADLRSGPSIDDAMRALDTQFGKPDILIHAAAITANGGVLDVDPSRYLDVYNVNVVSAVRLMHHCVPAMKEARGGVVLMLSSINADFATPSQAAYAASKAALNNLVKTAALELAPAGIRVNAIAPASIDTPPLRAGFSACADPEQAAAANKLRHPIARFGTPHEVAQLVLFLASDQAAWITGSVYGIDGGASVTRR